MTPIAPHVVGSTWPASLGKVNTAISSKVDASVDEVFDTLWVQHSLGVRSSYPALGKLVMGQRTDV